LALQEDAIHVVISICLSITSMYLEHIRKTIINTWMAPSLRQQGSTKNWFMVAKSCTGSFTALCSLTVWLRHDGPQVTQICHQKFSNSWRDKSFEGWTVTRFHMQCGQSLWRWNSHGLDTITYKMSQSTFRLSFWGVEMSDEEGGWTVHPFLETNVKGSKRWRVKVLLGMCDSNVSQGLNREWTAKKRQLFKKLGA
jgi:hypothetical protein